MRLPAPDEVPVTLVELVRVELPYRTPLVTSHGTETVRRSTLVRVHRADGVEGWGECVALTRPTYTAEYAEGAFQVLRDELVPALLAGADAGIVGHPFARAAIDGALVDGALRAKGENLARALGATRTRLPVTAVVGRWPSIDELVEAVATVLDDGVDAVTLKIGPGWDAEPLVAVRDTWPTLDLAADANGSYGLQDLELLRSIDRLGLSHLEQPLPARDLVGLASVAAALDTPVALDESIGSLADLEVALRLGAVGAVNVKPGRLGDLATTVAVVARATERGVPCWCGGMMEAGVGRAFALSVAAADDFTRPTHLGPTDRYFERDVTPPVLLGDDGTLGVPEGPGIGVVPDVSALDRLAVHRELLRP